MNLTPGWHESPTLARPAALALLASMVLLSCRTPDSPADKAPTVVEVIDGDTVTINIGSRAERVRLLGIDAPETVHPTVPEQCFGAEASAALRTLLPPGTEVAIERDEQARDHFGRLLLYLFLPAESIAVNVWMVENGYADVSLYEPNVYYRSQLAGAKRSALQAKQGLWSVCDGPDQPVE